MLPVMSATIVAMLMVFMMVVLLMLVFMVFMVFVVWHTQPPSYAVPWNRQ